MFLSRQSASGLDIQQLLQLQAMFEDAVRLIFGVDRTV
jgi:hypothetical protein